MLLGVSLLPDGFDNSSWQAVLPPPSLHSWEAVASTSAARPSRCGTCCGLIPHNYVPSVNMTLSLESDSVGLSIDTPSKSDPWVVSSGWALSSVLLLVGGGRIKGVSVWVSGALRLCLSA